MLDSLNSDGVRLVPRRLSIYLKVCLVSFAAAFLVQTFFQTLGATRSHWGGNAGWQREIAFWNVFARVILAGTLYSEALALGLIAARACTVLFFLLGTNHLFAFLAEPGATFHWPPLVLNYAGFVFGMHTLFALRK